MLSERKQERTVDSRRASVSDITLPGEIIVVMALTVAAAYPSLPMHVVCYSCATHKRPQVGAWPTRNLRSALLPALTWTKAASYSRAAIQVEELRSQDSRRLAQRWLRLPRPELDRRARVGRSCGSA
jgi:hypothetical protein